MVILNPRVSTLKVWIVFCFGNDFLIKSILTGCALTPNIPMGPPWAALALILQWANIHMGL